MDLVILKKIEPSILNGLGYIVRLEKKNGSSPTLLGGKCEAFFISEISEGAKLQANPENKAKKLEKSFWENNILCGSFTRKIAQSAESSEMWFSLVAKKLSLSENKNLIERFIKENLTSQGMIVDYAIDESQDKNG